MRYCGRREDDRAMCCKIGGTAEQGENTQNAVENELCTVLFRFARENERINPQNQDEKRERKHAAKSGSCERKLLTSERL